MNAFVHCVRTQAAAGAELVVGPLLRVVECVGGGSNVVSPVGEMKKSSPSRRERSCVHPVGSEAVLGSSKVLSFETTLR